MGSIGSKDRLQHTIIGDAVNTTARLEGMCKELKHGLLISGDVMTLAPEKIKELKLDYLGKHGLRGVSSHLEIYGAMRTNVNEKKVAS
jgi:adenylate cyclase